VCVRFVFSYVEFKFGDRLSVKMAYCFLRKSFVGSKRITMFASEIVLGSTERHSNALNAVLR
jgi:hypothetical protein